MRDWPTGSVPMVYLREPLCEYVPYPACGTGVLAFVEDRAKVCVGENGVTLEVRVVLLHIFPYSLLSLGLTSAIDVPSSVGLGVGWVGPGLVDGVLVPRRLVNVELLVGDRVGCSSRGRCKDESLDRGFLVGGIEGVGDTVDDVWDDLVGVLGEGNVGRDVDDSLAACRVLALVFPSDLRRS